MSFSLRLKGFQLQKLSQTWECAFNTGKPFFLEFTGNFQNSPPVWEIGFFYATVSGNFERFQYFNFETDVPENGKGIISIQNCHIRGQC